MGDSLLNLPDWQKCESPATKLSSFFCVLMRVGLTSRLAVKGGGLARGSTSAVSALQSADNAAFFRFTTPARKSGQPPVHWLAYQWC